MSDFEDKSAMSKPKILTAEQLCSQKSKLQYKTIMWHGIAITVRTLLSIREISGFVNSVMSGCVDESHDAFMPEMKDFLFRANTVTRYACVELPQEIDEQYEVLYNTDIYESIVAVINAAQLESLKNTIDLLMLNMQ